MKLESDSMGWRVRFTLLTVYDTFNRVIRPPLVDRRVWHIDK